MNEAIKLHMENVPIGDVTDRDEYFEEAARLVVKTNKVGIGFLQREFRIGFVRACNIIEQLCAYGIVGELKEEGLPREVLISDRELEKRLSDIRAGVIDIRMQKDEALVENDDSLHAQGRGFSRVLQFVKETICRIRKTLSL